MIFKPGVVIGKAGAGIEKLKEEVQKFTDKKLNLAHDFPPYLSFNTIVMWLVLFKILYALPCALGLILFIVGALFA